MTPRGSVELKGSPSRDVERDGDRTMIRRLGPVPADARIAIDLLSRRKRSAPGLAAAYDVGDRLGVPLRQRRRQQDVIELAEMPLLRPARVVERPAVEFGAALDDVLAKTAGKQHVEARLRFADGLESIAAVSLI